MRPTNSFSWWLGTRLEFSQKPLEVVAQVRALIFGSLAGRSPYNLDQLNRLLAIEGPMKFFDVSLRPPFADPALVMELAKRADVIKLVIGADVKQSDVIAHNNENVGFLVLRLRHEHDERGEERNMSGKTPNSTS
jgi:hypothetical protein